jgi:hypothetical protein
MHVDALAEELAERFDKPRMAGEQSECFIKGVGGKGSSGAPDFSRQTSWRSSLRIASASSRSCAISSSLKQFGKNK